MKLKKQHTPYISRKITKDIVNASFIELRKEKSFIAAECERILNDDIQKIYRDESLSANRFIIDKKEVKWCYGDRISLKKNLNNVGLNGLEGRVIDIGYDEKLNDHYIGVLFKDNTHIFIIETLKIDIHFIWDDMCNMLIKFNIKQLYLTIKMYLK